MLNTKFDLYKREWLDLVFAGRNKNYGAYDLRKHSGEYTMRAMVIMLACFAGVIVLIKVFNKPQDQTIYIRHDFNGSHYVKPPVAPKKEIVHEAKINHSKTAPKPIVHVATQALPIPKPTMEPIKEDIIKPQSQITNPGLTTTKPDGTDLKIVIDSEPTASGSSGGNVTGPITNDPVDIGGVDVMPEPVGGMAAWTKFLQRNIRYPDTDMEGRVYLSFIVEKDGKLSNITLVRGVSTLLDEEALRVLKIAPAWKPGQQSGQAVRVKYTLPIVFQQNQ